MTVQVEGGAISTGTGGVIFDNDGGLLRVSEIEVSDVTAASLIATASNGASFLERSTITGKLSVALKGFTIRLSNPNVCWSQVPIWDRLRLLRLVDHRL